MKKRAFLKNAVILTVTMLLLRTTNIGYRVYLSDKIGTAGMGLFQLILSVFILAITISTSGISLVVTRLVAEAVATGKSSCTKSIIRKCMAFSLTLSVLATVGMYFSADFLAANFLGDCRAALPLKILAPGLPFMAVCACLRGYFLAIRDMMKPASADMLEQFVTIGIVAALFVYFSPQGLENACCAIMLGSTAGELLSCGYTFLLYKISIRKLKCTKIKSSGIQSTGIQSTGVLGKIIHIGLPVTFSSTLRSILSTAENLLIPIGFKKNGATAENSLSQYGMIQGMVMPILFFPSAFLAAFSSLLIPEMAEANAAGKRQTIGRTTSRAIQLTLLFSIFIASVFIAFSKDLGLAFYKNEQAGVILRILAPLVPLMYLDSVVDGILKGLDQQLSSLKYNFSDSVLRVLLIYFAVPFAGTKGYIFVLFFSTIFNATLSINRLIKVSKVQVQLRSWVFKPVICSALAALLVLIFCKLPLLTVLSEWECASIQIVLSALLYYLFLRLCGSFTKEDVIWVKSILKQ